MVRNIRWAAAALVLGTASVASAQSGESLPEKAEQQAEEKVDQVKMSGGASNFGLVNQLVISQDFNVNLAVDLNGDGQSDAFRIALSPAADYFIQQNLSIGGFVRVDHTFTRGDNPTTIGAGVRAGMNFPVAEAASFWPKVAFAIANSDIPSGGIGSTGGSTSAVISLEGPVLFHPATHFFVGFGPAVNFRIGGAEGIGLALNSVVGGYF